MGGGGDGGWQATIRRWGCQPVSPAATPAATRAAVPVPRGVSTFVILSRMLSHSQPADTGQPPAAYPSMTLSASSLRWWAGAFCVFLGALIVVVPAQFTSQVYTAMTPRVALWGIAFTVAGWTSLAVAAVRMRPALQIASHVLVASVFALLAGGLAAAGAWSGTIVYSSLSVAILVSGPMPVRRVDGAGRSGDLFALVMGVTAIILAAWLLLFVSQADSEIYEVPTLYARLLGVGWLLTGVPLAAVQVVPVRRAVVAGVHFAAGACFCTAGLLLAWPTRSWSGVLFYGAGGILVAVLPRLRHRMRHFDPASLSSRLALMLASASSLPVVLTLGFMELGKQPIIAPDQRLQAFYLLIGVVGVALIIGFWGARGLARPLRRLSEEADRLAADEPVRTLPVTGITEVDRLSTAFSHMRGRLATRAREAEDLTRELKNRADALADADRRKDEFLAMLAHELRNPLGAISSASYLLEGADGGDPRVDRAIPVIQRQVQHLTRMVNDLLDVSRITRGKVDLQRQRLDLAKIMGGTLQAMEDRVAAADLELTVEAPGEPIWVIADTTRMEQVLGNLLTNAIRYTEAGGKVRVAVQRDGAHAVLRVSDTGIGMSEELLGRVFDLFSQGERSLERQGGGLGIGLTLVRQLVEMHDGEVDAHSEGVGKGSEFEVRLPLAD